MKVLVCGGRDYKDYKKLQSVLSSLPITHIITGDASGADTLAAQWALTSNIAFSVYAANWVKYGRAAGPIRNTEMLNKNPDIELVIAFPGGKGTTDMVKRAIQKQIRILEVKL